MSKKESKFYVVNFADAQINCFKKKILTPRAIKTRIQISYRRYVGRR